MINKLIRKLNNDETTSDFYTNQSFGLPGKANILLE